MVQDWLAASQLTPEYQLLWRGQLTKQDAAVLLERGFSADACTADAVLQLEELGFMREDVFYSALEKSEEALRLALGKCRLIANSLEELRHIHSIVQQYPSASRLESVGLRLIPEAYDDGKQPGIPVAHLPAIAREIKQFPAISIRGCFVTGNLTGLHGQALGRFYRACYETAKLMTVTLPCAMPYICMENCIEAMIRNRKTHPETLAELQRTASIVASQNSTAFYARLLIS